MKIRIFRIAVLLMVCMALILGAIPVNADIGTNPITKAVNWVYCYENCLETGDMLFWADYTVAYAVVPSQTINQTYILRLVDTTGADIRDAQPYPYFQNGYAEGLCAIYFPAADVTSLGLIWGDTTTYVMRLDGNPGATWTGGGSIPEAPTVHSSSFTWKTTTTIAANQSLIASDILAEATILQNVWASTSYQLVTTTATAGTVLTSQGTTYFSNVLPSLSLLAPSVLATVAQELQVYYNTPTATPYSNSIGSDFIGSPFDLTNSASALHIPLMWLGIILTLIIDLFVAVNASKEVNSYKPLILLTLPLLYVFTRMGWFPMIVTIIMGVISAISLWYVFFWEKSSS